MVKNMDMKIHYFDERGLAEVSRLILKMAINDSTAGEPTEDEPNGPRMFEFFQEFKSRPEFDAANAAAKLAAEEGKVPILEVDGVKPGQSKAIERFIAKNLEMMGNNDIEEFHVNALVRSVDDIKDAYKAAKEKAERSTDKDAAMKTWYEETLPQWLKEVEKLAYCKEGPNLINNCYSYADVTFYYCFLDPKGFFDEKEEAATALRKAPRLYEAAKFFGDQMHVERYVNEVRPAEYAPFDVI